MAVRLPYSPSCVNLLFLATYLQLLGLVYPQTWGSKLGYRSVQVFIHTNYNRQTWYETPGKHAGNSLSRLGIGTRVRKGVREDFQNEKAPYVSWRVVYELTRVEERGIPDGWNNLCRNMEGREKTGLTGLPVWYG